jgi:ribulose-5-phosphate 4-epimerase/fuculose-1-phosphate aldolase
MSSELREIKRQVAAANRVLADQGLATGVYASLGHASLRLPDDPEKFVVKGRGYEIDALARMRAKDMVVCDLDGNMLDGPPGATPCFEVKMHSTIFKRRRDVQSVVHVHPRFTTLMGVLGAPLRPMCKSGDDVAELLSRPLPVYPHWKTIQSEEEGMEVVQTLGDRKIVILFGHGATTTGPSLADAVMTMLSLEEQARINWYAYCAAGPNHPYVGTELLEESRNRPPAEQLPHFRSLLQDGRMPSGNGAWEHFLDLVS